MPRDEPIGLKCCGCKREIMRSEINDLLVDNEGAWHKPCYAPHPDINQSAKGVCLAA